MALEVSSVTTQSSSLGLSSSFSAARFRPARLPLFAAGAFPVEAALVAPSAVSVELEPSALGWPARQTKIKQQIIYFDKINEGDMHHLEFLFKKKETADLVC